METVSLIREVNDAGKPDWLKIPQAVHRSNICRSSLYDLIRRGKIRSVCLRDPDKVRGTRLINAASLDAYIIKHEGVWSEAPDNGVAK